MSSKIETLYTDAEKTNALYPRTKVSAISDDDGNSLNELLKKEISLKNIEIAGDPTALETYQSWDVNQEYGYYLDITIANMTSNMFIISYCFDIAILNKIAPVVETRNETLRMFTRDNTVLSGTLFSLIAREV